MLSERQIRLHLNDLHMCITDVLEYMDEHAYKHAEATLDSMQSNIAGLRKEVTEFFEMRERPSTPRRPAFGENRIASDPRCKTSHSDFSLKKYTLVKGAMN